MFKTRHTSKLPLPLFTIFEHYSSESYSYKSFFHHREPRQITARPKPSYGSTKKHMLPERCWSPTMRNHVSIVAKSKGLALRMTTAIAQLSVLKVIVATSHIPNCAKLSNMANLLTTTYSATILTSIPGLWRVVGAAKIMLELESWLENLHGSRWMPRTSMFQDSNKASKSKIFDSRKRPLTSIFATEVVRLLPN